MKLKFLSKVFESSIFCYFFMALKIFFSEKSCRQNQFGICCPSLPYVTKRGKFSEKEVSNTLHFFQ